MKGDFSRSTFDPAKHYSGVRMQQGRVQLDADWNENLDLLRHRIETETVDVIGECGVPIHAAAFGVVTDFETLPDPDKTWLTGQGISLSEGSDFYLTQGRAYVDGILVENDHTLPFSQQPFVLPKGKPPITDPGVYLLYLDVWERHITVLEDPAIREVALGGPDTATRTQVIWQAVLAKVGKVGQPITCSDDLAPWPEPSRGMLSARAHSEEKPDSPCVVPPGAGYTRLENQLYRVEINKGTANGGPTFKWSRDNGSVAVSIVKFSVDGNDKIIRTAGLGRDAELGLHELDWVEISDDASELSGEPGTLARIEAIDPGNILTLSQSITGYDLNDHPIVRRWDSAGEIPVTAPADNDGYLILEGGVEIKFSIDTFRTGDYWLIPARTVPGQYGDIEWPKDSANNPVAHLPFGIQHHYCKLAVLAAQTTSPRTLGITVIDDCRRQFPPLTELPASGSPCTSVTVGPGGDYADLPSALNARPADAAWWTVFVLPGRLGVQKTVKVDDTRNLTICGCGAQSLLIGAENESIFQFANCQAITLEGLSIRASSQSKAALMIADTESLVVANCSIVNLYSAPSSAGEISVRAYGPLVVIDQCRGVEVRDSKLMGLPAIQANGVSLILRRNRLTGGGIQIIPPSFSITIEGNAIVRGTGPGIQLGGGDKTAADYVVARDAILSSTILSARHMESINPSEAVLPSSVSASDSSLAGLPEFEQGEVILPVLAPPSRQFMAGIRDVNISNNLIGDMTGSGIITETSFRDAGTLGDIENLSIRENAIIGCCAAPDVTLLETTPVGGGIAAMGLFSTQITDNFIAENGRGGKAACGIFIYDGSHIDIAGNVVVENGVRKTAQAPDAYQAGIAAQYIFGNFLEAVPTLDEGLSGARSGYPAVRVRENRVVCPAGQALAILAWGSVAVEGNTLSTRESLPLPLGMNPIIGKGACIFVANLGLPVWLPEYAIAMQSIKNGDTSLHLDAYTSQDSLLANYPDGRVLFHDNQVTFHTAEEVKDPGPLDSTFFLRVLDQMILSALVFSLDDISLNGNQFQATVPPYYAEALDIYLKNPDAINEILAHELKFMHVASAGTIIRAIGNGFAERLLSNLYSYISIAAFLNMTDGNEATHAFYTFGRHTQDPNNPKLCEII